MIRMIGICMTILAAAVASAEGLSVTPAVVMLRGEPGQSTKQTLMVSNGMKQALSFDMTAMDVVVRDGKRVFVQAGEVPGSIAATAVFSMPSVDVPAGQSASVDVTVTLAPGARHRAVAVLFRGKTRIQTERVGVLASVGTLMTFQTSDEIAVNAAEPVVRPQSATHNLGVTQACSNTGSEPVMVSGVAALLDSAGALAGKIKLEPRRLLPSESADLSGEYPAELAPGRYRVVVTVNADKQNHTRTAEIEVR